MFGKNEIVGRKFFDTATNRLLVTSMFMTLQGEGPYRGEPAFFIRLAKCNLACSFCDTYFDSGDWFTFDTLSDEIDRHLINFFRGTPPEWARWHASSDETGEFNVVRPRDIVLVITGGEPTLQKNLGPFLKSQEELFKTIQIETNGTQSLDGIPESVTIVCSPKCFEDEHKMPVKYLTPRPDVLDRADCLKFVMTAGINPYSEVPHWAHVWHRMTRRPVFVSPMNVYARQPVRDDSNIDQRSTINEVVSFWEPGLLDMEANKRNHEHAARYCIQHGFIFNVQLHLLASVA